MAEDPLASEIEEKEEEELNAVRRYEDFTTVGKLKLFILLKGRS